MVVGIPMSWAISDAHSPQRRERVGNYLLESKADLGGKWPRVMDINAWFYYCFCACLNQGLPGYMSYNQKLGGGLTFRTCEQNHYAVLVLKYHFLVVEVFFVGNQDYSKIAFRDLPKDCVPSCWIFSIPETNSSHLKMMFSNRNLLFQRSVCFQVLR